MLTDQTLDPYSTESDDDRRQRVMQAMLAQSRGGNQAGALGTLDQTLKALAADQMQQQRAERIQNRNLGVNPIAPAFDDQGYQMPRAPGMVQPNGFEKLQAFFNRGG